MTPQHEQTPLRSPPSAGISDSINLPKQRRSPQASLEIPYRRANASLSNVFASTSFPSSARNSGTSTPINSASRDSAFSPTGSNVLPSLSAAASTSSNEPRNILARSLVPHVGVLASSDTEDMFEKKGFSGGFIELLRPFGDTVAGKVTVRDSIGASRTFEDFGVRFTGIKDLLGVPKPDRRSQEHSRNRNAKRNSVNGSPSVSRMGGNVAQVEELIEKHLTYSEFQPIDSEGTLESTIKGAPPTNPEDHISPFYALYLKRMLSALPLTPHETFSHPVACVIAISSRSPNPIEELRELYVNSNNGDDRLPQWVNNEFLRYYVLVHDDDHDDIGKSTQLYEQMKRHFGLHCHLLRLRSSQCLPSDDDAVRLPPSGWLSASEELAEIQRREVLEDIEDPTPCLFDSDATAVKTFIRELVTQSIIPSMERACATWNEQVATRKRGIGGKLMSLSKRWTPFGGSTRNASSPIGSQSGSGNSNYDSLQGFYRPDTPEAIMRKLADYAFMLRDFRLAHSTYDLCRSDYESDKAWKYYAGANEMALVSLLMNVQPTATTKPRTDSIDRMLEAATHSYIHRCIAPYYALRTLLLAMELLRSKGSAAAEDGARWGNRILENGLVGPVGHALVAERLSACYTQKRGLGALELGARRRKTAFWSLLAADSFIRLNKSVQAEKCLDAASAQYQKQAHDQKHEVMFSGISGFIAELRSAVVSARLERRGQPDDESGYGEDTETLVEEEAEQLDTRGHRHSLISGVMPASIGPDGGALSPTQSRERRPLESADAGFE